MKSKVLMSAALALPTATMGARAADVVDAAAVQAALKRGAIAWDVRSADDYAKGHIPGAVNFGNAGSLLRKANTEDLIPTEQAETFLNAAGIDLSKEVIVYSRMGDPVAHWCLVTVRHFSGKNGKVFHGGLDEWQAAGLPVSTDAVKLAPVQQTLTIDPTVQIYLREVVSRVGSPGVQFVDTRTPAEYSGDDIRALRGGHIPGAVNIPFEQNWADPDTVAKMMKGLVKTRNGLALKPAAELKTLYAGLDPKKETIVYCQSGGRASLSATVLRDLGFGNVRVFEESWLGYGNDLSAPAEAVQYVNIGLLTGRIKSLESTVETLNKEVQALKAAKR